MLGSYKMVGYCAAFVKPTRYVNGSRESSATRVDPWPRSIANNFRQPAYRGVSGRTSAPVQMGGVANWSGGGLSSVGLRIRRTSLVVSFLLYCLNSVPSTGMFESPAIPLIVRA